MSDSTIDPTQHKQLFLDDHAVAEMVGVRRTLHQPQPHGPVLTPDRTRDQVSVQSRSAPQWNPEKNLWEWWYWAYYRVPPRGQHRSTEARVDSFATSTDGIHWERPALGLYEWAGSKQNNIAHDPQARTLYHIIRDERESDPQRRYKALFDTKDRWLGVSPDGFTWTMLDAPPIPSQDESHFIYDETSGQYLALVKQPTEWGRSVWLSTSTDFVHFSEPQLILHTDEIDRANRKRRVRAVVEDPAYLSPPLLDDEDRIAQVYQMAVMPYAGLYVGFPVLFNPAGAIPPPHMNFTGLNQVELTVARDRGFLLAQYLLVQRVQPLAFLRAQRCGGADRALFLPVDAWDGVHYGAAQKLLCGRPHVRNDEIWVYYNALRFRGHRELYHAIPDALFDDGGALSLAKLRLDGFVSLDATAEGSVTTRPFVAKGGALMANLDAQAGEMRAEILDADTLVALPGYDAVQATPLRGDHLRGQLTWADQARLPADRTVRVRFHLRQARLYAFWVET